jgi:hypothetical protein
LGAATATTINNVTIPSGADTVDLLGTAQTITAAKTLQGGLTLSGNRSASAWTTGGLDAIISAKTLTDTSSSGTVAATYGSLFGVYTLAASSATTYTKAYGYDFEPPVAGTNGTLTNKFAVRFGGNIELPTGSATAPDIASTGAANAGIYFDSSGNLYITMAGANNVEFLSGLMQDPSNGTGFLLKTTVTPSGTSPIFEPNRSDGKAGIGADAAGDVSIIADNATVATEVVRVAGAAVTITAHQITGGSTPTCGTGCASVTGNDNAMVVTTGTAVTSMAVNFNATWGAAPVCNVTADSTTGFPSISAVSTTVLTLASSAAFTADKMYVNCRQ